MKQKQQQQQKDRFRPKNSNLINSLNLSSKNMQNIASESGESKKRRDKRKIYTNREQQQQQQNWVAVGESNSLATNIQQREKNRICKQLFGK